MLNRRDFLWQALFGTGMVGLRSMASGIPVSLLLNPRLALAAPGRELVSAAARAQYLLYSISFAGDPVNANAPGTYNDPNIGHAKVPSMAATPISFGQTTVTGAQVWSQLPSTMLQNTCFFHHATYTLVHPEIENVLRLMGDTHNGEMLPSLIATALAPMLGTVQSQPISLSGTNGLIFSQGLAQASLSPQSLKASLALPSNGLGSVDLVGIRDKQLKALSTWMRSNGNAAAQRFLDNYALSGEQARTIQNNVLTALNKVTDDSPTSQVQAALALFQMKVTPVVCIYIPFGGDNHSDSNLAGEVAQHESGVALLGQLPAMVANAGLTGQVSFAMTNVFGRTLHAADTANGRSHYDKHHVTVMWGPQIQGGVVGGVQMNTAVNDYQALPIGDIAYQDTFAAMGQTLAAACGVPANVVGTAITRGKPVAAALLNA